jgi:hypothetical protein
LQAYKAAPLQAAEQFVALGKKTFFENEDDDEGENDRLVALTTPIRRHSHTPIRLDASSILLITDQISSISAMAGFRPRIRHDELVTL